MKSNLHFKISNTIWKNFKNSFGKKIAPMGLSMFLVSKVEATNMNDVSNDMFYTDMVAKRRGALFASSQSLSFDVNAIFLNILGDLIKFQNKILDIGTGNGYVLNEINKCFPHLQLSLTGIDNSSKMLDNAIKIPGAEYICCPNENMPFQDASFDIVTAKNVTRFDSNELYRVLKENGLFIMREYSEGKGLVEVSKIFKERLVRSRKTSFYEEKLGNAGFVIQQVQKFEIKRTFSSVADLISTIKSYPLIENFSEADEEKIKKQFHGSPVITSDPFILVAKKAMLHDG